MADVDALIDLREEVDQLADAIYGYRRRLSFFLDRIADQWPDGRRVRVLDVGCGTGKFVTVPVARAGHSVLGIDFDPASIAFGQRLAAGVPGVRFACEDLDTIALRERFDVVIASEVLEHLRDPGALLRELHKVLEPGGVLLITVPNGWGLKEIDAKVHEYVGRVLPLRAVKSWLRGAVDAVVRPTYALANGPSALTTLNTNDPHVQFFRPSTLRRVIEGAGYEVLDWRNKMVLAGPTLNPILTRVGALRNVNAALVDRVPLWAGSGWMVAARSAASPLA